MGHTRSLGAVVLCATLTLQAQGPVTPQQWRLVEMWRSGGDTGLQLSFGDVADLEVAPSGHLLVLVRGDTPQFVSIDNTGRPVWSIGGSNRAPPLLQAPNGFAQFPDGRIVINNPRVGRLSVLSERGEFIRDVDYQPWGWTFQWLGFVAPDGALLEPVPDGQQLVWRRWTSDFSSSQLLPASGCDFGLMDAGADASFRIEGAAGGAIVSVPFLQPPIAIARGRDGSTWSGLGPDYRQIVHTAWSSCTDGPSMTLSGDQLPVPASVREAEQRRIRQLAVDHRAPFLPDVDRIPTTMPLFHTLRIDRQDRLWVERHVAPDTRAFSIFAPDGRHLASADIVIPIDTQKPVTFSDNQIHFFTTDDSGWTWLVTMRIERVG